MNKNLTQNQVGYTQTPLAQNSLKQLIQVTVQVLITGVTVALASVPAQAMVYAVENQQFQQESNPGDDLIAVNRHLNLGSDFQNRLTTQNAVDLNSTQTQRILELRTRNTQIYSSCLLYSQLPGCNSESWNKLNTEYLQSTSDQKPLVPIQKNTQLARSCWLFPWLPGCQGDGG